MSAFGTKRTSRRAQPMSAFGGKADMDGDPLFYGLLTLVEIDRIGAAGNYRIEKVLPVQKI